MSGGGKTAEGCPAVKREETHVSDGEAAVNGDAEGQGGGRSRQDGEKGEDLGVERQPEGNGIFLFRCRG